MVVPSFNSPVEAVSGIWDPSCPQGIVCVSSTDEFDMLAKSLVERMDPSVVSIELEPNVTKRAMPREAQPTLGIPQPMFAI